ncbi:NlpC/P60 family protein [Bacillus sp. FJAT-42376]|uniref:C40 family peptidase n=1 Tax=Bacillus sp. FJAT-42376 TaxID=2014076 RepID=UPI000F4FBAD8|nr:C40 family peptidase [Bacillus sp. FJAT-42376]AZB44484.1 NlpC/P60 family protein [Bacillus sp. FJAT-42376]
MKRLLLMIFTVILSVSFFQIPVNASEGETAYVNVSAATLWTEPDILREVDLPSALYPVDMRKWTSSMTLADKLQLSDDGMLETQALYGNKVTILERKGDWVKVAVKGQSTPRNELGYPGWMPAKQLTYSRAFAYHEDKPFVLVTKPTAYLKGKQKLEISYNTRLPFLKETKKAYRVMTPDGKKAWISKDDASAYSSEKDMPKPTGADLVNTGKMFLGLPYLWAGMSGFGFDCSGFTFTLHQAHGISIPRDSSVQARSGIPVKAEELQPGDLMFYAYDQGKGKVHHVSMYAGNGMMIHSPNSERTVEIIPVTTKGYAEEFAGARRYINQAL